MLYFSKLKLFAIYFTIIFLSLFSLANFVNNENISFLSKKVNLGLDLQGGSYLLLEVDSSPIIEEKLQNKLLLLRKDLKDKKIKYQNLKILNQEINFNINQKDSDSLEDFLFNKENLINSYITEYKSYELDFFNEDGLIKIKFSKYGLIQIKNSTLEQSLEIVRRRIDEVGTKDPTIIRRGNNRILIELPGLDDPNRIKNLLGKTANLTFRLVSDDDDDFGSESLFFEDGTSSLKVNKRVVLSFINSV